MTEIPPGNDSGQSEVNLLMLRLQIQEQRRQTAKEQAFKKAEDAKWERIKKERARKKMLREMKGRGQSPKSGR